VDGDRFGGQADMIATLVEQCDAPNGQPMGALPKHRRATGPGIHRQARELVDGVPGLGAEQLGKRQIVRGQEVNDQVAGLQCHCGSMLDWTWNSTKQPARSR
jgi:hypothetical protein